MTDPSEQSLDEIIADAMDDPEIEAFTIAFLDRSGHAQTYGESEGNEESYRIIPAAVLMQFASASNTPEKEFIKDVIEEYNHRKKAALGHHSTDASSEGSE